MKKLGISFFIVMFFVTLITMLMHEATHFLVAKAFGIKTIAVGLTQVRYIVPDELISDFALKQALISISGPVFTASMGLLGAWLAIVKGRAFGYELLFIATFQRFLAAMMSVFTGVHNDEARVSLFLGWDWWVLPAMIITPLFLLLIVAIMRMRFGLLIFFGSYITASLAFTLAVAADGQLPGMDRCDGLFASFYPEPLGCE